jgi:ISXO2-like transposase domain
MHLRGRRKYNKGRVTPALWVFGLISRTTKKTFYLPVPCRTAAVLIYIIKYLVDPNIKLICSDAWKSYSCLNKLGYKHGVVVHKTNFINPDD